MMCFLNQDFVPNQRPLAELGYEDGPWKGPGPPLLVAGHLCWWSLIFKRIFYLCLIGSADLDDDLTDLSLLISCSLQSDLVLVVRLAYTN